MGLDVDLEVWYDEAVNEFILFPLGLRKIIYAIGWESLIYIGKF